MGASTFKETAKGHTPKEAFDRAVADAQFDYGNGGYTGTIAEKDNFTIIKCPSGKDPYIYADELIDNDDKRVCDKWGPAGCIEIEEGRLNTAFPTRCTVDKNVVKGTKEWQSFYVGYTYGGEYGREARERFKKIYQDEAIEEGKKISLKEKRTVRIFLEKRLVNCEPIVATITPVPVKENGKIGKYLFFGWASD